MVEITYTSNAVDGTGDGTFDNANDPLNSPATVSTVDPNDTEFNVGDAVTVNANPFFDATYQGTDGNGGMIIRLSTGQVRYFSNGSTTGLVGQTYSLDGSPADNQFNQDPICFAAGTLIATPDGETAVESLRIGDLVLTADGRAVPVKWIGRQTVHKIFTPAGRFAPVRIRAGALDKVLPRFDLVLTADHAVIIDALAINAGALVNGTTVSFDPVESLPDRVTYYHVETEDHEVILANGMPAETYVDYVRRQAFSNYQEYLDLYGEQRTVREMHLPRISASRMVPPSIKARLIAERAA